MDTTILAKACTIARGLSIDAVTKAQSGHLGLPLGATEIGAVLFGQAMQFNPDAPTWVNRDRFILSAGHGSMFLYSWLHLAGYALSLEEVANFRQLNSLTPGHPEYHHTPGVEATTGPLGQGVGNAVGYALSDKMAAAKFNSAGGEILDYHVIALAGDGCLQEGVANEAASFAGHIGLDNLILFYDSNDVTLDAMADLTQSEDTQARFQAMGWDAVTIDGHDLEAVLKAFEDAKAANNGKPKIIICKTEIGRGIPEVAGTQKAHGEGGVKFADSARAGLGLPAETFYVSDEVKAYFAERKQGLISAYDAWQAKYASWKSANPELATLLESSYADSVPADLLSRIPEFTPGEKMATRASGGKVIQAVADAMPMLVTGSADLFGSTKNYINSSGDLSSKDFGEKNIWYGIREHGMGAILNGMAYDGIFRPSGATFAVFADYLRPSIRLAALSNLPVTYILTHDSVGVGEDGPTHQPVETVSGLRVIPGLDVIRPADSEETAGAFAAAMLNTGGPTALFLTRQNVADLSVASVQTRREGVAKGGYVLKPESGPLSLILLASGSEVEHAVAAAETLGEGVRVVSMPCMERFDAQSAEYQESVLPASCTKRVAIEAGVSGLWYKYVGLNGKVVGIDRFGLSAPGGTVMSELGMTAENLAKVAQSLG